VSGLGLDPEVVFSKVDSIAIRLPMKITEIAFSCYPVTDMARARAFYEGVLGLTPSMTAGEPGGMEWTEYDIANGTLSLGAGAPDWKPSSSGCSVGLEVDDFEKAISHLKENGVTFQMEPFPTPVCRMAFILDPDGNSLCIHKRNDCSSEKTSQ
jgi:predicted enzyme related to lactoylglutathione lyase